MSKDKHQIINLENYPKEKSNPLIKEFDGIILNKLINNQNKAGLNNSNEIFTEKTDNNKLDEKIEERLSIIKKTNRNERIGFTYCLCAQFLWTLNNVYLKFLTMHYHTTFKNKTFLFARGFATMIICFYFR